MDLTKHSNSTGLSCLHLQFTAKYRRDVFSDVVVKKVCEASLRDTAGQLGVVVAALDFGPDHVHLLVEEWYLFAIPEIARRLKGASSRALRLSCWRRFVNKLWGDAFWTSGYFYETIGRRTYESAKDYVENQQVKHWN